MPANSGLQPDAWTTETGKTSIGIVYVPAA
jgi:hypothetical protein